MLTRIERLSQELNLPIDVIIKVYKAYWLYIRKTIESLPLKEDLKEEDFSKLRVNYNIPNLGKLTCTYDRYKRLKNKNNLLKEKKDAKYKKDKANG